MEALFPNDNNIVIFMFGMLAIYNYSHLREYQRMAIIYISVYLLTVLNVIGVKLAFALLLISLFCFFEIFTSDETKFKIIVNPIYKIIDFLYISFSQYAFGGMCISLIMLRIKLPSNFSQQKIIFNVVSLLFLIWTITCTLQQKFVIYSFREMYKIFVTYPINKVEFNQKLDEACSILVSIEDTLYFDRRGYTFLSPNYIVKLLKNKLCNEGKWKRFIKIAFVGRKVIKNIVDESRGYSTIQMQLIRSIGIKRGYNYKYRRKIFEILYSRIFFKGIERMLKEDKVSKRQYFKKYLLYIYFHKVNTFLGDAIFSKFLNAFDMKYNNKNDIDIYECSNEGIFIACMGLSKRANIITKENIGYYLKKIDKVNLDPDKICCMVENMMNKPYNGNYLK